MFNKNLRTRQMSSSERRTALEMESSKGYRDITLDSSRSYASPYAIHVRNTSTPIDNILRARFNQAPNKKTNNTIQGQATKPNNTHRLSARLDDTARVGTFASPRKLNLPSTSPNSSPYYGFRSSESASKSPLCSGSGSASQQQMPEHPYEGFNTPGGQTSRQPPKLNEPFNLMAPRRNERDFRLPRVEMIPTEPFFWWLRNYFVTSVLSPQQRELCQSLSRTIKAYMLARLFLTIVDFAFKASVLLLHVVCTCLYVAVGSFLGILPRRTTLWKILSRTLWKMTHLTSNNLTRYAYILIKLPQLFCIAIFGFIAELYHELRSGIVNGVARVVNNF